MWWSFYPHDDASAQGSEEGRASSGGGGGNDEGVHSERGGVDEGSWDREGQRVGLLERASPRVQEEEGRRGERREERRESATFGKR